MVYVCVRIIFRREGDILESVFSREVIWLGLCFLKDYFGCSEVVLFILKVFLFCSWEVLYVEKRSCVLYLNRLVIVFY